MGSKSSKEEDDSYSPYPHHGGPPRGCPGCPPHHGGPRGPPHGRPWGPPPHGPPPYGGPRGYPPYGRRRGRRRRDEEDDN